MTTTVISYSASGISGCPYPGWGLYYKTTVSGATPLWVCYAPYYDPATGQVQGMTNYMNPTPEEVKAFLGIVTNDTVVITTATGTGKEYVFEFNGVISQSDLIVKAISKIVTLLGGKSVYIEGGNKIVVVM